MNGEEIKAFAETPHFFNLYMASMRYMFYRCIECTRGCPGAELRPEYSGDIPIPINATSLEKPADESLTIFDMGNWDPGKLQE